MEINKKKNTDFKAANEWWDPGVICERQQVKPGLMK